MRALTIVPGRAHSARLEELPEPPEERGSVLVETLAIGVCGTDRELVEGRYGAAPPGEDRLVLGHESLGRVIEAPPEADVRAGDLVVAIVRRPDPVPCPNCAVGEWDMCTNGLYTEHGIKGLHGFASERFRVPPDGVVRVDAALGDRGVLVEPASVVAKAWQHIERIGRRARFEPVQVLVTGAGPIGLLAALLGVQRGLRVTVLDRATEGPKPALVRDLGAEYVTEASDDLWRGADIILECTGAPALVCAALGAGHPNGIVCLTGVSSGGRTIPVDLGALNRDLVLENAVVFGTVNANRAHYDQAKDALLRADAGLLERLITRRVPLVRFSDALRRDPGDVKTLLAFQA